MLISIYIQGNFNCKSSQPLDIFSRRTFQKKRLRWLLSLPSVTTEVPWSCLKKLEISLSKERKCELYHNLQRRASVSSARRQITLYRYCSTYAMLPVSLSLGHEEAVERFLHTIKGFKDVDMPCPLHNLQPLHVINSLQIPQ